MIQPQKAVFTVTHWRKRGGRTSELKQFDRTGRLVKHDKGIRAAHVYSLLSIPCERKDVWV